MICELCSSPALFLNTAPYLVLCSHHRQELSDFIWETPLNQKIFRETKVLEAYLLREADTTIREQAKQVYGLETELRVVVKEWIENQRKK